MTGERPIAGARIRRVAARRLTLLLAGTALTGLLGGAARAQATDQDSAAPAFEAGSPLAKKRASDRFGLDNGQNGLPALRNGGLGNGGLGNGTMLGGSPASGEAAGGASDGQSVARLPRFRTAGSPVSGISGARGAGAPQSLLRQRAAPPRRYGVPTRILTRTRTQGFVTDLRLSPVIQPTVSGVPLPLSVPLPTAIPLLGLSSPGRLLLGATAFRRPDEADPAYAPLGIKLGTMTFLPAFTQGIGYDTNPEQTTANAAKGSLALRSDAELGFRSDWSSSELSGELRGGYSAFPDNDAASRPNASGITRMRVDVSRDTRIDLETRFLVDTQRTGSPDVGAAATSRPLFATYGASAGITESFNRLQVTLRGSIDRQVFDDAQLQNGGTLIQSDRNANQYGVRLRAGYEISPVITPFVEVLLDTRIYDTPVDQSGFRRDSDGAGFSAGAAIALTRFVSAEVSAGLQRRDYVDRALRSITAPILNAALVWQASPLTTVRFSQQTGVIETSVPGSSGVFTDAATLEVQHDLLRNLSITVGGAYLSSNYQGVSIRERGFSALARADYRFNRWLTLRGSYVYQQITSSAAGSSFNDNIFLLGMRINP
ncbi:outer membrane beta-barrel protein [Methylobacterium thuringiense]|uniref:Outer membrane beta-barrel protein n=2 Tax=Methylobacterium TaxID=407 RepID=A0ABQ4TMT5_9HYPH|nr:outer membrane beta-barrel protein [Methylobacterium thuringiense]GJE55986.1 hypothetical protein EKPJFOCH_2483 [Methylobacterium thuringiense]